MATVEMELSEFKRMEQTEEDLRLALKREQDLHSQIDRLNEEKIQAYKDNETTVTIVNVEESHHTALIRQDGRHIINSIERILSEKNRHRNSRITEWDIERLIDMSFDIDKSGITKNQTVTRKGLDEVIQTIREEEIGKLDKECSEALENLPIVTKMLNELKEKRTNLLAEQQQLSKTNKELLRIIEDKELIIEEQQEKIDKLEGKGVNKEVEDIISSVNIFNIRKKKDLLISKLNESKKSL